MKILLSDLRVGDWIIPAGFQTDECTWAPELDIGDACILHDFLRRYAIVTVGTADRIFRHEIQKRGHPVLAWVYWWGVKLMRPWFRQTREFPYKWSGRMGGRNYSVPVND